jgi:hypothetical protein
MKNINKYNVTLLEGTNNINGGCFAWDVGFAIRTLFLGQGNPAHYSLAAGEYAAHYAGEDVH